MFYGSQIDPPDYIKQAVMMGGFDPAQWRWNPDTQSMMNVNGSGSLSFGDIADPSLGTNVDYSSAGGSGVDHFDPGQNPSLFLNAGGNYSGGVKAAVPGSELYRQLNADQRTRANQGLVKVGVGIGASALGANSAWSNGSNGLNYGSGLASASDTAYGSTAAAGGESVAGSATAGAETLGNGLAAHPFLSGLNTVVGGSGASSMGLPNWANLAVSAFQGILGNNAANRATNAATAADERGIAEIGRQYDQSRTDQMPWLQAGTNALGQLQDPNKNFQASPDYAFRRSEGLRDIGNSFAARGGAASGNALRALTEFNQNLASGEFGNWWNRQAGLAGVGQTAANSLGQFGANAANNTASLTSNQGATRASGILGGAAAIGGAVNDGYSNYVYQNGGGYLPRSRYGR